MKVYTDEDRMRRAEQSRVILDNPMWQEAWETVNGQCINTFETTALNEIDKRESAKAMHSVLKAVRMQFERAIVDGKVAAQDVALKKQQRR